MAGSAKFEARPSLACDAKGRVWIAYEEGDEQWGKDFANNQFKRRKAGLAMAIRSKNVHYLFHTIEARHWHALAMKNGGPGVWKAMVDLAGRVEAAPQIAATLKNCRRFIWVSSHDCLQFDAEAGRDVAAFLIQAS